MVWGGTGRLGCGWAKCSKGLKGTPYLGIPIDYVVWCASDACRMLL